MSLYVISKPQGYSIRNVLYVIKIELEVTAAYMSLLSDIFSEHIDPFVLSFHELKYSFAEEIGLSRSQPFTNSHFHLLWNQRHFKRSFSFSRPNMRLDSPAVGETTAEPLCVRRALCGVVLPSGRIILSDRSFRNSSEALKPKDSSPLFM
jgi:hypothetical protein